MTKLNFWRENKETVYAQLLVTAGSLFVAFATAFLTFWYTTNQQQNRDEQTYYGLLHTLHTELYWHDVQLKLLRNNLKIISKVYADGNDFLPLDAYPIHINLTDQILLELIEYKNHDLRLASYCSTYSNQIKMLNYSTNFKNLKELAKYMEEGERDINAFVYELDKEYITKSQEMIYDLQKLLSRELDHLPEEETLFNSYFESRK